MIDNVLFYEWNYLTYVKYLRRRETCKSKRLFFNICVVLPTNFQIFALLVATCVYFSITSFKPTITGNTDGIEEKQSSLVFCTTMGDHTSHHYHIFYILSVRIYPSSITINVGSIVEAKTTGYNQHKNGWSFCL